MKFVKSLVCAAAAIACLPSAFADVLAKAKDSGEITFAYRESSVPFSYLSGGQNAIGFSVDISNAVADAVRKEIGKPDLKVKWQSVTSANRIPLIQNGTIVLECGSTTNNAARNKDVDFAINYFYTGTRVAVKKSSGINSWADLKGKTLAITTGTTNLPVVRKYSADQKLDINITLAKDHSDGFLLMENDRAAGFAMDDILLYGLKANSKDPAAYEVVADALQVEPYACMLPKDDPAFKKIVDGVIGGMMKSGDFTKLYDKWFLQPIPPKNQALGLPMNKELKDNLTAQSDKPAT
ncbi:amino acid ABC transporter substrate-binding protein [Comamonas piscis]|uniref:Amino acid ABC transporter substrate-binding protein n=1 Tax=Comamonas piscis TaxID=1562974 RepID=A0A7G5ECL0_9BURK|nr:amino acid ABC transporter substrate-binding protein [Comamonas piscis]QMV71735.1 amino acid ABC transporter substrate-binding protein [Comamonas piscis]WSO34458.1 amino acid ABC transporter substrate-binding protein [Comamonas piscis]